jgi:hypothetical protein
MSAAHPLETITLAPRPPKLPFMFTVVVACPTFAFAFWTILSHIAVAAHLSFQALARIGPFALMAGVVCGIFAARDLKSHVDSQAEVSCLRPAWTWVTIAAVIVALRALGVGYQVFWIASVLLLVSGMVRLGRGYAFADREPAAFTLRRIIVLLLLALASAAITYVVHRPNVDDAIYVGTAADAVAHPELPLLSHDVLYGVRNLPLMLPSYAVEAYEPLIAFFARSFGGAPIFWAHAIAPTLVAAILPFAWASLMRTLVPQNWLGATAVALLVLSLPAQPRGLGDFAYVTLFQGKSILVSVGIPLLYSFAWKFQKTGLVWDGLLLAAGVIASVGLSASAVFIIPLALAAAAFAAWRPGMTRRALLTFLPALYPLACGLAVGAGFKPLEAVFAHMPARAALAVTMVFSARAEHIFLFTLLASPFLVRDRNLRWKLMVVVLIYFIVALNPFTFKLLARLTTRDAVWRVLWCAPVVGVAAATALNAVESAAELWGWRGRAAAVLSLLCSLAYVAPYSSFAISDVTYSLQPLKVRNRDWETARHAIALTPPGAAVLAPDAVAISIPTFVHRPPLVSVRELYDEEMGAHMLPEEARTRVELRELVSGQEFPAERVQVLLSSLPQYQVGLILTSNAAANRLRHALAEHGYSRIAEEDGYVFFSSAGQSANESH